MAHRRAGSGSTTSLLLGGLLVLVGIVLLGNTTGMYDVDFLFQYLPSLFVLLGLYVVIRSGFRSVVGPLLVVTVAGLWQLSVLDVLTVGDVSRFWPLLLVLAGASILGSYLRDRVGTGRDDSHVTSLSVFSGRHHRPTSQQFTGADLTAVFGGAELDLREAGVAAPPARVTVTALFGGADITVPADWQVELDVIPVLGGAVDERSGGGDPATPGEPEKPDLVVSGLVIFGGVTVEE